MRCSVSFVSKKRPIICNTVKIPKIKRFPLNRAIKPLACILSRIKLLASQSMQLMSIKASVLTKVKADSPNKAGTSSVLQVSLTDGLIEASSMFCHASVTAYLWAARRSI